MNAADTIAVLIAAWAAWLAAWALRVLVHGARRLCYERSGRAACRQRQTQVLAAPASHPPWATAPMPRVVVSSILPDRPKLLISALVAGLALSACSGGHSGAPAKPRHVIVQHDVHAGHGWSLP